MTLPELIARYIDAYNTMNIEALLATLSEDVVFENRAGGQVHIATHGKAEFRALAEQGRAAFSARNQTVIEALTVADTTLARIAFSGTVAADLPNGWTKGQELAFEGRSLFECRDDQIVRVIDES